MKVNRSMPPSTATAVLVFRDISRAIDWLGRSLGFTEVWRIGNHGALLSLGDGQVFIRPPRAGEQFVLPNAGACQGSLMWRVDNATLLYQQAVQQGVRILQEPTDEVYGERQFAIEDLDGHHWTFSETIADVAPEEWGAVRPGNLGRPLFYTP